MNIRILVLNINDWHCHITKEIRRFSKKIRTVGSCNAHEVSIARIQYSYVMS